MRRLDEAADLRRRLQRFSTFVAAVFAALVLRLIWLQAVRADDFRGRAQGNLLELQRIPPIRGLLLASDGRVLAKNRPSYDLYLTPRFLAEGALDRVIELLDLSAEEGNSLRARVASRKGPARHRPLRALRDLDRDQLARIETERLRLDGVRVEVATHRAYPEGATMAHVVGYMNEASAADVEDGREHGYVAGDLVGRAGAERLFESQLRGVAGVRPLLVDARGRLQQGAVLERLGLESWFRTVREVEARAGSNVILTLDLSLQKAAERALAPHPAGAIVALDAQSGRILAMVSKPNYDPNLMTGRLSVADVKRIEADPYRPLIDKTMREDYFPGSIYKVLPAVAALEDRLIDPSQKLLCSGSHELGRRVFRCPRAHGLVDLEQAIVQSCNVYFYRLAERVGMDRMAEVARDFGLGAPSGLGLNGDVGGFVPTKDWYLSNGSEGFRVGFTLNAAIGQGNTKVTVLQMALVYSAIGNGGRLWTPQLARRIETPDGRLVEDLPPKLRRHVAVSAETLEFIRRALTGVVYSRRGTAFEVRPKGMVEVAGKTGTAQVRRRQRGVPDRDHAWFAAFAPAEEPTLAVAVLVEHGGQGSKVAAPIAMDVFRAYFRDHAVRIASLGLDDGIEEMFPSESDELPTSNANIGHTP